MWPRQVAEHQTWEVELDSPESPKNTDSDGQSNKIGSGLGNCAW